MEIAEVLRLTPRQTLATITLAEFTAYSKLGADRTDEIDEAHEEDGVDLTEMQPTQIAAMFGADIVQ